MWFLIRGKIILHGEPILFHGETMTNSDMSELKTIVYSALQYNDVYSDQIYANANSICNLEGGTPLSGFRRALKPVISTYARSNNMLKEKDPVISSDDI